MRPSVVLVLLACTACHAAAGGQTVSLLDYETEVPPSFQAHPVSSQMRLAEYTVQGSDSAHADVVVYYFGQGQGGSAQANIARWTSQFTTADGGPVTPRISAPDGTSFPTTVAEYEGSYARGVGMGPGAAAATPDQGLVAAVVETPQGNLFLQLFGDRTAVAAVRKDFLHMVTSIRPAGG
jgi:hypothetical protein